MKNRIFKMIFFMFVFGVPYVIFGHPVPYAWKTSMVDIITGTPPALFYVTDSFGNATGANPNLSVSQFGQQNLSAILRNIPQSGAAETNIPDNTTNVPNPGTSWNVSIMDGGTQSYQINLVGIESGDANVRVSLLFRPSTVPAIVTSMDVLVNKGVTRTVTVNCDPAGRRLQLVPIVAPGDLLLDTQSACSLKDIAPEAACDVLESLASAVEKAITNNDTDKERHNLELYLRILNRLHNWGNKDARHDWDDFKDHPKCDELRKDKDDTIFFAKDPAYSALKLDAETLLNALP